MNDGEKMCCICFKIVDLELFELSKCDTDNISFIDKLQDCIQKEFVRTEDMQICSNCVQHLNISYTFRNAVLRAQEVWSKEFKEYPATQPETTDLVKKEFSAVKLEGDLDDVSSQDSVKIKIDSNEDSSNNCEEFFFDEKTSDVWEELSSFPCEKCLQNFSSTEDLLSHNCNMLLEETETVDGKQTKADPLWACPLKLIKLRKHRRRYHMPVEEKKYVCTYCNKSFKQSYHLREHITTHTGERKYSCAICDKKFQRISSQKRHMRTHEAPPGQKSKKTPFLCTICGKSFPYSNGAQRHMRIHTGVKNFECKICSRKFSQSTHLHVHLRTHTGEKPYVCDTCGEAFSLNASLQKHMNVHENDDTKDNVLNKIQFEIQLLNRTDVGVIASQMAM